MSQPVTFNEVNKDKVKNRKISKIPFDQMPALSHKDVFYQTRYSDLGEFISFEPTLDGLMQAVQTRKNFPVDRQTLVEVLTDQYQQTGLTSEQQIHIKKLASENTFTIVTAHQPSLLGGPGYYFYKIYSAIHLAKLLQKAMPDCHFVPVFINGAEDHDFDEIKSVHLFGKTVTWNSENSGPVGRFPLDNLTEAVQEMTTILGNSPKATYLTNVWSAALQASSSYNEFVHYWVNDFFKEYGLIVLNMDDVRLKKNFIPVMERELVNQISEPLVQATQVKLESFDFKPQAHARPINLFYISGQSRERIIHEDNHYLVNNTELRFGEAEIIAELHRHPERFSPNVVIRPLYEEFTLPNLAYIGGGGELAYWLERKSQFEAFDVFFPVLIRRNSVMIIPSNLQKSMEKLQLTEMDLLMDEDPLIEKFLQQSDNPNFELKKESKEILGIFHTIAEKAKSIDPTLEAAVLGEAQKTLKSVENIETRLKRSLKQKEEVQINQLRNLKAKLFPNNGLQERAESFLQFWIREDDEFDHFMIDQLNPLEKSFLFIYL